MEYVRLLKLDFMQGNDILVLQEELKAAGFFSGETDGVYGPQTVAAVKAFQKAHDLTVDGIVGQKTWNELFKGKEPPDIVGIQRLLNRFGYDAGEEDGVNGSQTMEAINTFKAQAGLSDEDGLVAVYKALKHIETRLNVWNFENVRQFQAALSLLPDGVVGEKTIAALEGEPIVPKEDFDFSCQCRAVGKNYCNGWNGMTEAQAKKHIWAVRVLHERIMREVEKQYPDARKTFYLPTVATPSETGSIAGGVRCERWNEERSGASGSKHLEAYAIDIFSSNATYEKAYGEIALQLSKYNGAHVYSSGAVHIDITDTPQKRRW